MSPSDQSITFPCRQLSGSRLRCLMYTSGSPAQVAGRLTRLIAWPEVAVAGNDLVLPRGFLCPDEARLGETPGFLSDDQREQVTDWWLEVRRGANTPNWDLVAQATIEGRPGLVLFEAKAHAGELDAGGKPFRPGQTNELNHAKIGKATQEAKEALDRVLPGWNLSRDSHYQLSNRFAWSWKLASLGVPIVLAYVGFLNADEMSRPFRSAGAWADQVREWSSGTIPPAAWGAAVRINGTPLVSLIRAVEVLFEPSIP